MNSRRDFVGNMATGLVAALGAHSKVLTAFPGEPDEGPPGKKGTLEWYLKLLDYWGPPPEAARRFYEAAFKILAAKPDATYAELASNGEVRKLCAESGITHLGGPMLGAVTPESASVWLRTLRPAKVEVLVRVNGGVKRYGPVESTLASDLTAVVPVTGLKPGTSTPYRLLIDGERIAVPEGAAIVTPPEHSKLRTARIAFGSCPHVWGLGNSKQAEVIRKRGPVALLVYGDVSAQDNGNHRGLARVGYLVRESWPAWRNLVASVPVFVTWDDHDYFRDDGWGIPPGYTADDQARTWEVFRHAWNNPSYGFNDERRGVFLRTRLGPCDVIMLDNRYFRKKGSFLGEEQMTWLEAQLLDCKGPFITLSCGTMWSDYVSGGKDSWGTYDREGRERIFSLIERHRIPGVLLLSGDRHGARVFRIPRSSGFAFYEFGPASLGGRIGAPAARPEWRDFQLFGMTGKYAFGEFTFDISLADPEVTFRLVGEDNSILHELTLKRSQLTPPR